MAEKKKAYKRFGELTQRAMGPVRAEAERGDAGPSPAEEFAIRLNPEVARALEESAAERNTTPSEVVEEALRRFLNVRRWR